MDGFVQITQKLPWVGLTSQADSTNTRFLDKGRREDNYLEETWGYPTTPPEATTVLKKTHQGPITELRRYSNTLILRTSSCTKSQTWTFHWNLTNWHTQFFDRRATFAKSSRIPAEVVLFNFWSNLCFHAFMCKIGTVLFLFLYINIVWY